MRIVRWDKNTPLAAATPLATLSPLGTSGPCAWTSTWTTTPAGLADGQEKNGEEEQREGQGEGGQGQPQMGMGVM